MLYSNCYASQATRKLWPSQLASGCIRHAAHAYRQPAAHTAVAAAAAKVSTGPLDAADRQGPQLGEQQQHPDPPDVSPHVLLSLDPIWLGDSSSSSDGGGSAHPAVDSLPQTKSHHTSIHGSIPEQQQQLLIPRTSTRLHGMSPPGFLPRVNGWAADPQVALWQQQASQIWREAAAWAQQRQQQGMQQQQQQQQDMQQQQQQPVWLQRLSAQQQHQPHWGPVAAAVEAAGPCLQVQHLAAVAELLANLVQRSTSSKGRRNSDSDGSRSCGSNTTDPLRLLIMALDTCSGLEPASSSDSPMRNDNGGFNSSSSSSSIGSRVVLNCSDVLPKLTLLMREQLQQQQQQQDTPAASSSTSSLDSSSAVQLLQHLSFCQINGSLGRADPDAVSALVGTVDVQAARLVDLSGLISSCARLGHALRSSWLAGFVRAAVNTLQKETADAAAAAAAAGSAGGVGSSRAAAAGSSSRENAYVADARKDSLVASVSQLLDGLSLYPGPHNAPERLQPCLAACEPWLHSATLAQLHMLLTAAAHLSLTPSNTLLHSAAAAARRQFGMASLRELVLLLQGLTAASGWQQQQQVDAQQQQTSLLLDDAWWLSWYEATAMKFAAISLAASVADGASAAAAAAATDTSLAGTGLGDHLGSSTISNRTLTSSTENATVQWATQLQGADLLQQQQQQVPEPEPEEAHAELLIEVCLILLEQQQQQQVHPLWLAGMLEAYQRSAYSAAATPQLLLLVSELFEQPALFAARHKVLLQQLVEPLQEHLAELTEEQLTQAAEVCSVYEFKPGAGWFRWHAAAVLRFGRFFPLEGLARIRAAYSRLEVVPDERMQQMLDTVPWRLERQEERQRQLERLEKHKATMTAKNEQRRRQNEVDRAKKLQKKAGAGPGADGKQQWRKRKLKPPGTLNRKF